MSENLMSSFYEALTKNPREKCRVLSIQSHVVHGYAGNKCSVFPLQLHGFEVDPINSVQFSNHAGTLFENVAYKHVKGQTLNDSQLSDLYEGLKLNDINNYAYILTGYCGNPSFLMKIADIVRDIKKKCPDVVFVCDPVLGDNGRYYTPKELMPIYRDVLVPLANVITPNVFELSELSGETISNESECLRAMDAMHRKGVQTVVVTSGLETATTKFCYGSKIVESGKPPLQYRFDIPILPGMFVGTGDVFSSLLVVWLEKLNGDMKGAIERVIGSLQGILRRTAEPVYASNPGPDYRPDVRELELRLVQSRADLLLPRFPITITKLQ
uniref:Pyridoxal kinase n=1 Tax=Parascaris univalens TaxID=6257 RepID=A0A915AI39_PARUN